MKYAGMPFGMWVLFAGSFQKQLTAYDLSLVVVVLQNLLHTIKPKGVLPGPSSVTELPLCFINLSTEVCRAAGK